MAMKRLNQRRLNKGSRSMRGGALIRPSTWFTRSQTTENSPGAVDAQKVIQQGQVRKAVEAQEAVARQAIPVEDPTVSGAQALASGQAEPTGQQAHAELNNELADLDTTATEERNNHSRLHEELNNLQKSKLNEYNIKIKEGINLTASYRTLATEISSDEQKLNRLVTKLNEVSRNKQGKEQVLTEKRKELEAKKKFLDERQNEQRKQKEERSAEEKRLNRILEEKIKRRQELETKK